MRKYKENEDNRERFFEERTKAGKQVFGASTNGGKSASDAFGSMFSGQGDLALSRKMEKASITVEKVEENTENTVVEPKE